jgi:hypothetical protein
MDDNLTAYETQNVTRCSHRASHNGKPCQNPAGRGTNHIGTGYCSYHDKSGDMPVSGRHLPLIQMLDPAQRPLVVRMIEDDSLLFDLRFEAAVLRGRFAEEAALPDTPTGKLADTAKASSVVLSRLREMEIGKHNYFHVRVLSLVLHAVGQAARQYVPFQDQGRFADDLEALLRRILPRTTAQGIAASLFAEPIKQGVLDAGPAVISDQDKNNTD